MTEDLKHFITTEIDKKLAEKDGWLDFKEKWEDTYLMSKEEMKGILKTLETTYKLLKTKVKKQAPTRPFSSTYDREQQFMRSVENPKNYYNFQAFGIKICIHYRKQYSLQKMNLERGDWYFIAITGWLPTGASWNGEKWKCYSPHINLHDVNYFQATQDIETAIVNFYIAVKECLIDIGVDFNKNLNFIWGDENIEQKT